MLSLPYLGGPALAPLSLGPTTRSLVAVGPRRADPCLRSSGFNCLSLALPLPILRATAAIALCPCKKEQRGVILLLASCASLRDPCPLYEATVNRTSTSPLVELLRISAPSEGTSLLAGRATRCPCTSWARIGRKSLAIWQAPQERQAEPRLRWDSRLASCK